MWLRIVNRILGGLGAGDSGGKETLELQNVAGLKIDGQRLVKGSPTLANPARMGHPRFLCGSMVGDVVVKGLPPA
jgi:hypothetical protein